MSYSHAADAKLAIALKSALERFARPWYRRRSFRVFLDDTNLSLTPKLWSSIESALESSDYLVLLASPEAAQSEWVNREIGWWLAQRSTERCLLICTRGAISWNRSSADFDWGKTDALPTILSGRFSEEPLYLDCTSLDPAQMALSDVAFRNHVASLSAVLRGRSKDDLLGEDLTQHRRAIRHAVTAAVAMFILMCASVAGAFIALRQRALVERQLRVATARQLAADAKDMAQDGQLSLLLALQAVDSTLIPDHLIIPEAQDALEAAVVDLGGERKLDYPWIATNGILTINQRRLAVGRESFIDVYDIPTNYNDVLKASQVLSLKGDVHVVSFGPDGVTLASASGDGTVALWDLSSGELSGQLIAEGSPIRTVVFSPDGRFLLTGNEDGRAFLWDEATRRTITELSGHEKAVITVAFNATSSLIATGGADRMAVVWDRRSGKLIKRFGPHGDGVNRVAFSPDGRHLATASGVEVTIWDMESGERIRTLTGQRGTVSALLYLPPDGKALIAGSLDGSVRTWDAATGSVLSAIDNGPEETVRSLAVTSNGDHLVALGFGPTGVQVRVYPLGSERLLSVARSLATRALTEDERRRYLHIDQSQASLSSTTIR